MRLASYVPGELIPCAFVWLDPGITPCCKSRSARHRLTDLETAADEDFLRHGARSRCDVLYFTPNKVLAR